MVKYYNSLPASTKLLIQSLIAVLGSVISGVVTAEYQSITQSGHLDLQAQLNVALVTFALLFGKAMHDWVPAHAQQLIQTITVEKAQLTDALQRAQNVASAAIANNQSKPLQSAVLTAQPSHTVVPVPANLKPEDIGAISAQIAMNLINLAANRATQAVASTTPVAPAQPATPIPAPYVDPLKGNSAVLPAYTPPIADQATQVVPQVPFTV